MENRKIIQIVAYSSTAHEQGATLGLRDDGELFILKFDLEKKESYWEHILTCFREPEAK